MIATINTGSNFGQTFKYLLNPNKQPRQIGGNTIGDTVKELTREFTAIANTRLSTQKPVKHIAVAFAPEDGEINDEVKVAIATALVKGLGYTNNQYAIIDHHRDDPGHHWVHDHDHIHIVVNSVTLDQQRTSDSHDTYRVQKIARKLEAQYNLVQLQSSWEVSQRRPTHGQVQRHKKETREYEEGLRDEPPKIIVSQYIQEAIAAASNGKPTVSEFVHRLQKQGIEVYPRLSKSQARPLPQGFSYTYEGVKIPGYKLKNSSFRKLLRDRGLRFSPKRDLPVLEEARERSIAAMAKYEQAATAATAATAEQTSPTATTATAAKVANKPAETAAKVAKVAKVATETPATTEPAAPAAMTSPTATPATQTGAAAAATEPTAGVAPAAQTSTTAAAGKSRTRSSKQEKNSKLSDSHQPEPIPQNDGDQDEAAIAENFRRKNRIEDSIFPTKTEDEPTATKNATFPPATSPSEPPTARDGENERSSAPTKPAETYPLPPLSLEYQQLFNEDAPPPPPQQPKSKKKKKQMEL